ncbi:MAG: sigma-70 family RNA polymerase sigma factor [Acidimicrobiales bacterium]
MDGASTASDNSAPARVAAASLYREHVDAVHRYVARRLGTEVAGDIVAETFRIALESFDRFDPIRGTERAWIFGIATNLIRRHWRSEQRRLKATARHAMRQPALAEEAQQVVDHLDATADVDRVWLAVAQLRPDDRDLVVLIAWEGFSHDEVASVLGIPTGTVRSRRHRIRAELRRQMAPRRANDG